MKSFYIFIIAFFMFALSYSQQLFQDASGNTSISLNKASMGYIFYNTTDKSVTLGYNQKRLKAGGYDLEDSKIDFILGGDLKIKTSEGIGNIFSKEQVNPGFLFGLNMGLFKDTFREHTYLTLYLRPTIGYNQYKYINVLEPTYKIDNTKKVEASALFNANFQINLINDRTIFVQFQTGFKQDNNYDDLDDGQISTTLSQEETSIIETISTGKLGEYKGYNVMPLYFDFGYTPRLFNTNVVGFNAYYRTELFKDNNTSNAGLGLYLADSKKPSKISGGLAWQVNDLYNQLNKDTNAFSRSTVFIYAGFAIGK